MSQANVDQNAEANSKADIPESNATHSRLQCYDERLSMN